MTALKNQARYDEVVNVMWQLCVDEKYPFPDKISYNILIDALGKAGRYETMEVAFKSMIRAGFQPDVRTFTSMLHAYGKVRQGMSILATLDIMQAYGIQPNVRTYTVLEIWLFGMSPISILVEKGEKDTRG